jgi:hypothetical protein
VDEEVEGNLEGERDWTISWIKDLGCWPRFNNGGSRAERLDSIARDGVAIYQTCSVVKRTGGDIPPIPSSGRCTTSKVALVA